MSANPPSGGVPTWTPGAPGLAQRLELAALGAPLALLGQSEARGLLQLCRSVIRDASTTSNEVTSTSILMLLLCATTMLSNRPSLVEF